MVRLRYTAKTSVRVEMFLLAGALCSLGACGPTQGTERDEEQVNGALLKVLTASGRKICVDRGTHGEPLAIFRAMLPAPDPARRPLYWSAPAPLQQGRLLSNGELVDLELRDGRVRLPERRQSADRLPFVTQKQLNSLAREASLTVPDQTVRLQNTPAAPLATVRWWVLNRFDSSCDPVYTVSNPVFLRNMAFLSVTAAHQGSTYAFHKNATGGWVPSAKWSTWLY